MVEGLHDWLGLDEAAVTALRSDSII